MMFLKGTMMVGRLAALSLAVAVNPAAESVGILEFPLPPNRGPLGITQSGGGVGTPESRTLFFTRPGMRHREVLETSRRRGSWKSTGRCFTFSFQRHVLH